MILIFLLLVYKSVVSIKSLKHPAFSAYYHSRKVRSDLGDGVIYQACPCTCSDHMGISGSTRIVRSLYVGPINVFFPNIKLSVHVFTSYAVRSS